MEIRKATRQGVKPLIALYSESGCGKTFSALLMARGLVGPKGRIIMIDTESGRGSLYADVLPGGYDVIELVAPFTPARYVEAIDAAEQAGDCIIGDSITHEWEGSGGVLDMAAEIEDRTKKAGLHCWRKPKFEHALFVSRILRCRVPFIACIRAKYKSRQTKDGEGKTVILKDKYTSPIQADDFIFEATAHGEIMPDHGLHLTKWSHPELQKCFPVDTPITVETGEAVARWCAAPAGASVSDKKQPGLELPALKAKLWEMTRRIHGCAKGASPAATDAGLKVLHQYLWDENYMLPEENLHNMTAERLMLAIKSMEEQA